MKWTHKHLLGVQGLSREEISFILQTARSFKEISTRPVKKVPTLRGKTVINLFLEPSTRTRVSFEIAEKRLSADSINISESGSSLKKGESLKDMVQNLDAMHPDIIVVRHAVSGVPHMMAQYSQAGIINAGDGTHEHPSQALLDLMTMQEELGPIEGLEVSIVGDIAHSRVARSNIYALKTMGASVSLVAPDTFIPLEINKLGVKVYNKLEEALPRADVVMMLRIQKERQGLSNFPTLREYARFFGLNSRSVRAMKKKAIIMHPGPINRGVEISPEVADGERAVILNQVTNGVALRMALLFLLTGGRS